MNVICFDLDGTLRSPHHGGSQSSPGSHTRADGDPDEHELCCPKRACRRHTSAYDDRRGQTCSWSNEPLCRRSNLRRYRLDEDYDAVPRAASFFSSSNSKPAAPKGLAPRLHRPTRPTMRSQSRWTKRLPTPSEGPRTRKFVRPS